MRYSGSLVPGRCLITSKTPPGTFRLMASLRKTISPSLNLWDGIGFLAFPGDNRSDCASKQNQPNTPQQTVGPYHALIAVRHQFTLALSAGILMCGHSLLTLQDPP